MHDQYSLMDVAERKLNTLKLSLTYLIYLPFCNVSFHKYHTTVTTIAIATCFKHLYIVSQTVNMSTISALVVRLMFLTASVCTVVLDAYNDSSLYRS